MEEKGLGKPFTRRSFLKTTALIGGVAAVSNGLAGCSSIGTYDMQNDNEEQVFTTYCNACMGCPLEAVVRNDNVVLTRAKVIDVSQAEALGAENVHDFKRMCARGASIPTLLVQDKRVKYPMRRIEGTERGAGQWERITWDEAIDEICTKIKAYQKEFGKSSVCAFTYGTTEPRNLWNLYRLENLAEFSHQERVTDFALAQGLFCSIGLYLFQGGTNMNLVRSLKTFVIWGHNPIVSWPNMWHYIADAIENGCKLVVIDPNYNTIAEKADLFVSVRPGTDGALALGLINYFEEMGLTKDAYMQQKSCAPLLVKQSDGMFLRKSDLDSSIEANSDDDDFIVWDLATDSFGYAQTAANPALRKKSFEVEGFTVSTAYSLLLDLASEYSLERTAEITSVPEETIVELAAMLTANDSTEIFQGYGIDHYGNGFNTFMATSAVRIVCGMVPDPVYPWSLNDSGFTAAEADHPTNSAKIATFMFNDLIDSGAYEFPGFTMEANGQTVEVPGTTAEVPLKMLLSFGANIINSCPDRNETIEAYKKLDFHVAVNVEWCDTCDYADIVLPASMIQESIGPISMDASFVFGEQCTTPKWESKPDFEIAKLIGQGLGFGKWFTEDMDEAMAHVVNESAAAMAGIDYELLKQQKLIYMGWMPLPTYPTSTGRMNFYQETPSPFQYFGQIFNPAEHHLPTWQPPMEAWPVSAGGFEANPLAEKYPLTMIAGTRRFRVHSYYGQNPLLREMEVNEPCVRVNPVDAEARGIADGDYVRLFNDRGHAVAKAVFSAGIRPGGVDIDRGWQGSQYISGCSQDLTSKQIVDWTCPNHAYHDCLVQMEKWDGK